MQEEATVDGSTNSVMLSDITSLGTAELGDVTAASTGFVDGTGVESESNDAQSREEEAGQMKADAIDSQDHISETLLSTGMFEHEMKMKLEKEVHRV